MDFEFLHGTHDAVDIKTGTTASEPDDWDRLPAHKRLYETFANAELAGNARKIGEVIAVIRQSDVSGRHGNRF